MLKLRPHVVEKIWGGIKLKTMKNISADWGLNLDQIGETWEVSLLKDGPSYTEEGNILSEQLEEDAFKYLVKFIDTSDDLSVQVHPDDQYAQLHENSLGKTECWFILDANEGEGIYLGLKEGVTRVALQEAIEKKENLNELLNFYPVKAGDFFYVPAGTIHAIGKGVTLAEVQQSSGVTYRVWDWNRVDKEGKSRELHVKKAMDVINFSSEDNRIDCFRPKPHLKSESLSTLIEHRDFSLDYYQLKKNSKVEINRSNKQRPSTLLNLDYPIQINDTLIAPYEAVLINDEERLIIQATSGEEKLEDKKFLYIY